jgi:hypothetical protein
LARGEEAGEITGVVKHEVGCADSGGTGDVAGDITGVLKLNVVGDNVLSAAISDSTEAAASTGVFVLDGDSRSSSVALVASVCPGPSSSSEVRSTNESGIDALIPLVLTTLSETTCF